MIRDPYARRVAACKLATDALGAIVAAAGLVFMLAYLAGVI